MKRFTYLGAALVLAALVGSAAPAAAGTRIDVRIGDPYRGAYLSFFRGEPDVVVIRGSGVRYARRFGHDFYHRRGYWYFVEEGLWYRARHWRGPFIHVHVRAVPREILRLPARYRSRWYGPYATREDRWGRDRDRDWDRHRDRDEDRDWDRRDRDRDEYRDRDRRWERDGRG